MKGLYLECNMGASGDMIGGALLDLFSKDDRKKYLDYLNSIFPKNYQYELKENLGIIRGSSLYVKINGEEETDVAIHHHVHFNEISDIIKNLSLSNEVKVDILNIYEIILEAESKAHGVKIDEVHLHELGAMDAVLDITIAVFLIHELNLTEIISSPINIGYGEVKTSHGILPVPCPATSNIILNIPVFSDGEKGELLTPTGASILKYYACKYSSFPNVKIKNIGVGFGKKIFKKPNILRAFLYEKEDNPIDEDSILCLSFNIDDMTGEELSFVMDKFLKEGALDFYFIPIYMKKSRPGNIVNALVKTEDEKKFIDMIFFYTETLGVRKQILKRNILRREKDTRTIKNSKIDIKTSFYKNEKKEKIEFDSISYFAEKYNLSFRKAKEILLYELKKYKK